MFLMKFFNRFFNPSSDEWKARQIQKTTNRIIRAEQALEAARYKYKMLGARYLRLTGMDITNDDQPTLDQLGFTLRNGRIETPLPFAAGALLSRTDVTIWATDEDLQQSRQAH